MAAGLSLKKENLEPFRQKINAVCTLTEEDLTEKIRIDVPMPMDYVGLDLIRELDQLEPFGRGNEQPLFAEKGLSVRSMRIFGQNKNVLKFELKTPGNRRADAIYFGDIAGCLAYIEDKFGKEALEAALAGRENNITMSFVYQPQINVYRGNEQIQFHIKCYQ